MYAFLARYFQMSKLAVILIDMIWVLGGYVLAYLLRFGFAPPRENIDPFIQLIPVIVLATYILFSMYGLYTIARKTLLDIVFSLGLSLFFLQLIVTTSTFFIREFAFPRSILIIAFFIQWFLLSVWRAIVLRVRRRVHGEKRILLIGSEEKLQKIGSSILGGQEGWYTIAHVLSPTDLKIRHIEDFPEWHAADTIALSNDLDEKMKKGLIESALAAHKFVLIEPAMQDIVLSRPQLLLFHDVPMIALTEFSIPEDLKLVKRWMDTVLAFTMLLVTFPLMLVVAALIKLTSPGPVFYRQERVTEGGKTFMLIKFRTMVKDAEKRTGPVLATEKDPRITSVGRVLRATRLDELPQLINVLKGEMSLIGPRPERPHFIEQFSKELPAYSYRHQVKAGITGLAQVVGRYSTSAEDKLALDLFYIKNYSLLLDVRILFMTVKVVLSKEAASGVSDNKKETFWVEVMDRSGRNQKIDVPR
ncbi:MAG: Bacterial sugar transferase [Candidatus Carbobacillus altaicus]|uniref:Bacterial sugar transferase n=1 Tax=Candidatus Carbonibacillus altaicus TaxID=2163959 RepID=A0A2R6Y3Q3_9BACL|nr:MAG: Bacterial sugar transferase [Candidatus Carbobacillus altaicus]